jgi:hypothetical protein
MEWLQRGPPWMALLAALEPALSAARTDPMVALRTSNGDIRLSLIPDRSPISAPWRSFSDTT